MPTILGIAELEHPQKYRGRDVERMRGRSLAGVSTGTQERTYAEDAIVGGEMINGKWMRQGDYKAVRLATWMGVPGAGSWKLYNLKMDPSELHDLSKQDPKLLTQLIGRYDDYSKNLGVIDMPADFNPIKVLTQEKSK